MTDKPEYEIYNAEWVVFGALSEDEQAALKEAAEKDGAVVEYFALAGAKKLTEPTFCNSSTYRVKVPIKKTVPFEKDDYTNSAGDGLIAVRDIESGSSCQITSVRVDSVRVCSAWFPREEMPEFYTQLDHSPLTKEV